MTPLAPLLEAFFTERLITQRRASQHTVAAYRDTFRLLLRFAQERTGKTPAGLALEDLDAPFVGAFLEHLEAARSNTVRTRNARLAAVRAFFRFAALREPAHAALIQRVLAIPQKRTERLLVEYLTREELQALLASPDQATRTGRRDHALILTAAQTGLRVSELTGLTRADIHLGAGKSIRCTGKGRKERRTPLTRQTVTALRTWLAERGGSPADPVFPGPGGCPLTRSAVWRLIARHARAAAQNCPSMRAKHISPHTLRHTAAMQLLAAGVDRAVIALWLGCAARRSVVSPAQRAEMRGEISGSDGLPESEKCREQQHARKPAAHAQAYGVACRETRVTWRKLHCLNPNLQKVQMSRPPERRLKPVPVPAAGCPSACSSPPGAGAMPHPGI